MFVLERSCMTQTVTATFKQRLTALDVPVRSGGATECAELVDAAAGEPAVGISPEDPALELPDRIHTDPTAADLRAAHTGVTKASLGVADYGSVAIESDSAGTEPVSLFVDRHVVLIRESDIVPGMADAFEWLGPRTREADVDVVFATGPSATADMGGLVKGAHGPKEVVVVLITDAGRADVDAGNEEEDG